MKFYDKNQLNSGKNTQNNSQTILRIQGVSDKRDTDFYLGKRVVYVYTAKSSKTNQRTKKQTKFRVNTIFILFLREKFVLKYDFK